MNEPSGRLRALVAQLEQIHALDQVATSIEPLVKRLTRDDAVKRVLSGAPLGHRAHPMLTDVPIGCWTAATLVDVLAWRSGRAAAQRLAAIGVLAALPTTLTGLSDWDDTYGNTRRVGVAHMSANVAGTVLQIASWRSRRRGHHTRGAVLGAMGLGAVAVGGYLGGHLVFVARAGVDHEVPLVGDQDWHEVCRLDDLTEGRPFGVDVGDARVVLVREAGKVYALAAVCNHAGGPLDEGDVRGEAIVCPWHGSTFCLADGEVERGPATSPQPAYETRVRDNAVEVRARVADKPVVHAIV
jgi:nitrite reductase/ring-hydroxylating ferredoxin subunit/uncharacterized membrane protein